MKDWLILGTLASHHFIFVPSFVKFISFKVDI